MAFVLGLLAIAALLGVVRVLFLAARARPDDRGLLRVARIALAAWVVFALWSLVDLGTVRENAGTLSLAALWGVLFIGIVAGYRALLARIRARVDDRQAPTQPD